MWCSLRRDKPLAGGELLLRGTGGSPQSGTCSAFCSKKWYVVFHDSLCRSLLLSQQTSRIQKSALISKIERGVRNRFLVSGSCSACHFGPQEILLLFSSRPDTSVFHLTDVSLQTKSPHDKCLPHTPPPPPPPPPLPTHSHTFFIHTLAHHTPLTHVLRHFIKLGERQAQQGHLT